MPSNKQKVEVEEATVQNMEEHVAYIRNYTTNQWTFHLTDQQTEDRQVAVIFNSVTGKPEKVTEKLTFDRIVESIEVRGRDNDAPGSHTSVPITRGQLLALQKHESYKRVLRTVPGLSIDMVPREESPFS